MCIAAPGKIVRTHNKQADVDYGDGVVRTVLIAHHKVRPGDHVLVQMGIIVKILSNEESSSIQKAWSERTILSS